MSETLLLPALKTDLGITATVYDTRLTELLQTAQTFIATEGVTLDMELQADRDLVVMYAAYLWRERDSGKEMPRMLRFALNNRLFGQKGGAE